jgi:hypothetical protein
MPNAILDPTGGTKTVTSTLRRAPRRGSLRGTTVLLLINTKQNAREFLGQIGTLLIERHGVAAVTPVTKVNFAQPEPEDKIKEMAEGCDAVVTGIGDCGSCSASAVADGVAFEAAGVPAAVICSDAFIATADAMAGLHGAPGYRYATTPHPVAVLTPEQVQQRAAQVVGDVAALLIS